MKLYLFIFLGMVFSSCSYVKHGENFVDYSAIDLLQRSDTEPMVVDLESAVDLQSFDFMKKNVDDFDVIQLDSLIPIGKVSKMCVAKGIIVLLTDDMIYAYNQQTGKLIYHINKKGHGHNEYLGLRDLQILEESSEILAIDDLSKTYFYFDLATGKFLYKERSLIGAAYACKYEGIYFSSVAKGNDFNEDETWGLLASDSVQFRGKQFRLRPLQCVDFVKDNIHVYNGKIYFNPLFSDTVYVVNKNFYVAPAFMIKQKKSLNMILEQEMNFASVLDLLNKQGYTFLDGSRFFESNDALFFYLHRGLGKGLGEECFVYDKISGKLFRLLTADLHNHQYAIFPHDILYVKENRLFGLYLDGQKLKDICNLGNIKVDNSKLNRILTLKQVNHNPIVVSFKYKH